MNVLLLGATGVMGRRAAAELARVHEVERLVVAGRNQRTTEWLASMLSGRNGKVRPLRLDVGDVAALERATHGADVIASCAGPAALVEAAGVAIAVRTGIPYVSLCDDYQVAEDIRSNDDFARESGVTIVSGCGFSPGITNLLAAVSARELDTVDEIEIAVAGSASDAGGAGVTLHVLTALSGNAPVISDHKRALEKAATAPKLVYFPEPMGWVETFRCGHPEVVTLPESFSDVRTLQFRFGLSQRAAMDLIRATAATDLFSREKLRRPLWFRVSRAIGPLLTPRRQSGWTSARVDVRGEKDGRASTVSMGVLDHLVNLATLPLALVALKLGARAIEAPGVHAPEEVLDAKDFLRSLTQRGIRVARLEPYRV